MPERDDFTVETSNKQLNFVQHIMSTLKQVEELHWYYLIMFCLKIKLVRCLKY